MLKTLVLAITCSSLLLGACVASVDDDALATSIDTAELEAPPVTRCPDLRGQTFLTPQSCMKNGQLGIQDCTETCDLYRSQRFRVGPPPSVTCVIDHAECTPQSCGPCVVIGEQGPP